MNLIQGDCLEEMKSIPDNSIDMILTDPPYGTTACKWDTVIDLELMWIQLKRVIKDNGAIVLFGSEPFSSYLRISNIKMYKYDWIWHKNKSGNIFLYKISPMKRTENICVFINGALRPQNEPNLTFNHDAIKTTKIMKSVMEKEGVSNNGNRKSEAYKKYYGNSGYRGNILKYDVDNERLHPTQKPVSLIVDLINTYTNKGETVLDFTMGSGTTGVACIETGRKFTGIELDKDYYKIACDRIKQAEKQLQLF